uniref:Uncharacterized protein n=1 Tax=Sphaerodactylus townsendi TaxID=933632 RepID=A0ACB8F0Y2_9SAUR
MAGITGMLCGFGPVLCNPLPFWGGQDRIERPSSFSLAHCRPPTFPAQHPGKGPSKSKKLSSTTQTWQDCLWLNKVVASSSQSPLKRKQEKREGLSCHQCPPHLFLLPLMQPSHTEGA